MADKPTDEVNQLIKEAKALEEKKEFEGAVMLYEKAHSIDPKNPMVIQKLNELHFKLGNLSKSKEYFLKLIKINPDYSEDDSDSAAY